MYQYKHHHAAVCEGVQLRPLRSGRTPPTPATRSLLVVADVVRNRHFYYETGTTTASRRHIIKLTNFLVDFLHPDTKKYRLSFLLSSDIPRRGLKKALIRTY